MRYLLTILFFCGAGLVNAQSTVIFPLDTGTPAKSVVVRIVDATDGTPETGVTTSDSPAFYYQEWGANANSSNFYTGDHAALTDAWDEGEIYHIGSGYYRVDIPDAVSDSEGTYTIHGAITDMVVIGCTVQVTQALTVNSSGHITPADGSISEAKFADVSEPTSVPPTSSINPLEMIKYMYFYGAGINKTNSDLTSGEGEMQYYDSGGTKRFERDVTKSGTVTTKDEVRAND